MDCFERIVFQPNKAPSEERNVLLVTGYSGVGKSALINEIHKPITARRVYFISGKFDQLQRDVPYIALIQAFNQLCDYLLTEPDWMLAKWKASILKAVGQNGQVLLDVIPNLERVIGPQPAVPEVGIQQSQNRFNLYFQYFIQAITSLEHPLVIFLDDLQWADQPPLNLLQLILTVVPPSTAG